MVDDSLDSDRGLNSLDCVFVQEKIIFDLVHATENKEPISPVFRPLFSVEKK